MTRMKHAFDPMGQSMTSPAKVLVVAKITRAKSVQKVAGVRTVVSRTRQ